MIFVGIICEIIFLPYVPIPITSPILYPHNTTLEEEDTVEVFSDLRWKDMMSSISIRGWD